MFHLVLDSMEPYTTNRLDLYIEFGGKTYWTIDEEAPQWRLVNDDRLREGFKECLLQSDSFLRVDHEHLRLREFDTSEKEKYDLEE